ncbi:MAG: aspartate 1-decarboxylase [Anaerolineaceae bacterium 4572_5.1]|nr:MAG: aspartate 1-decarboxylase [Anaerolineaceae bacterium 4572_5.1]RLD04499.1 MAG: aspartate 1-decarboxylase [Chloroflexota bacterium]
MYRKLLKSKIHRAVVTGADIHYEGSITIDSALLEAAGIHAYELVHVVDVDNGSRLETYTIPGEAGSGVIQLNGAAARLVSIGDRVIIMSYAYLEEPLPEDWNPIVLLMDEKNQRI